MQFLPNFKKLVLTSSLSILFFLGSFSNVYAVDSNGYWEQVGNLNVARVVHTSVLLNNGKVLITGGTNGSALKSTEIYDPLSKSWTIAQDTNVNRYMPEKPSAVVFSDGKVLIAGGENPGLTPIITTELYDPSANTWSFVDNLNVARFYSPMAPLSNDRALIIGGATGFAQRTNTAEIYDYAADSWTLTGSMGVERQLNYYPTVLNDGRVLIVGGTTNSKFADNTAEVYNPTTGTWTPTGPVPFNFNYGTVTTLNDGRVLIAGSLNNLSPFTVVANTAIYDPNTNNWSSVSPMPLARSQHDAVLLDNGNVMIFGGIISNQDYVPGGITVIYNPTTDTWTYGPSMPTNYRLGAVTKLNNGDFLVAGGTSGFSGVGVFANSYLFTNGDSNSLNVPYFSQNNELWGSEEYDSASLWSPNDFSISSWGCALTSAVMILKFHGYNLLPDGTEINPSTLNDWFMAQNDNYIRNGLVNWSALNRLTTEAKQINNITDYEALDYIRIENNNRDILTEYIEQEIPVILEIPTGPDKSHFVVANGIEGESISINDPLGTYTNLDGYNNEFRSMRVLKPTNTDLSAIQIVVNQNVNIDVKKSSGIIAGSQFLHLPIENDEGTGSSGEPLNIYYLHDPESGNYNVTLSSDIKQKFQVDVYLYDEYANVKMKSFNGVLTGRSNDEITIEFSKLNAEKSKINRKRALGIGF